MTTHKLRIEIELTDEQLVTLCGHAGKRDEPRKAWTTGERRIMVRRRLKRTLVEYLIRTLPGTMYDAATAMRDIERS